MDLFHLQAEAHGSGLLAPQRLHHLARSSRPICAAGSTPPAISEIKTPQLMDAQPVGAVAATGASIARTCSSSPTRSQSTEEDAPVLSGEADLMALKPMNCPAHILVFKQGITSYRDLPLRLAEFGCCHRNEPHGALHGIMRVRQFTQDDAHIFCREDQMVDEVARLLRPARQRLPRPRLRQLCDQARASPRQALRQRRGVGPGRGGAARRGRRGRAGDRRISAGRSCRAKAPSTRPSSNST